MKKLFITLLATVLLAPIFAQTEHMKFKGIPIDGSLADFTTQMKQKGFIYLGAEDGSAVFTGEFASYKDCSIGVISSHSTKTVSKVGVIFPEHDTWAQLYGNYSQLKELLIIKYGEPTEITEMFQGYEPDDDNLKMHEVGMNRCKYISSWETEKGTIILAITYANYKSFVTLVYEDKINSDAVRNSALDDL